jgi:hypothetical protein
MISSVTGEVVFADYLQFSPHEALSAEHIQGALSHSLLPIPGWTHHFLGEHPSNYGPFEVEAVSDRESRIQTVLVRHAHPFYEPDTPEDSERRAFHESVIGSDLHGQQEFSWGEVFCHLDIKQNKDWLIVVYKVGPQVPLRRAELLRHLREHEGIPDSGIE